MVQRDESLQRLLANRGVPLSPANPSMTPTLEPGDWVAVALGNARSIARVKLSSGEETSLTLTLGSGARIAGRVVFDGTSALPALTSVRLGVRGVGPDAAVPPPGLSNGPVAVKADGSFEMGGVVGTIELQTASPLQGFRTRKVCGSDRAARACCARIRTAATRTDFSELHRHGPSAFVILSRIRSHNQRPSVCGRVCTKH
jgi:hypothetical protein